MTIVRIAVIGLGNVARHVHLPLARKLRDRFEVTAVCDSRSDRLADAAQQFGVPATACFTDAEAMLSAGGFEAVLLLTSGSHAGPAASAMRRGYPVFCEKPLAHHREEGLELAGIEAGQSRPLLMLGYMKLYDPAVTRAVQLLAEAGGPDSVGAVDVSVLHPPEQLPALNVPLRPPPQDAPADVHTGDRALWEYRALLDSVCHDMALIRLLGGNGQLAVSSAAAWRAAGDDPGSIEFTGPLNHGRYSVRWHFLPHYPRYREQVTVHHHWGSLELDFGNPYRYDIPTTLTEHGADRRSRIQISDKSGFECELEAFHLMVTEGTRPLSGIADGVADIPTALDVLRRIEK
jgi:myo-inositol 2-dehydrogenase / D-chiro-inositol 1-dehydrogenase